MHGKNILATLVAFTCVAAALASPAGAEEIDDPQYTFWAKFKPGSFSTTATETDGGGHKMMVQMTCTLMETTGEKVTLEIKTQNTAEGHVMPERTVKKDVAAKRIKPANFSIKKSNDATDVAAGAKTYACQLTEETQGSMLIKTWNSEKVPGGVVKMEMTAPDVSMKTRLVEFGVK